MDHAATALSYCQAIRTAGGTKVAFVRENKGGLPLRSDSGAGSRSASSATKGELGCRVLGEKGFDPRGLQIGAATDRRGLATVRWPRWRGIID